MPLKYSSNLDKQLFPKWNEALGQLLQVVSESPTGSSGGSGRKPTGMPGALGFSPLRSFCEQNGLQPGVALAYLSKASGIPIVEPEHLPMPQDTVIYIEGLPILLLCRSQYGTVTMVHALPFVDMAFDMGVFRRLHKVLKIQQVLALPDAIELYYERAVNAGRMETITIETALKAGEPTSSDLKNPLHTLTHIGLLKNEDKTYMAMQPSDILEELENAKAPPPEGAETAWAVFVKNMPFLDIADTLPDTAFSVLPLSVQRRFSVCVIAQVTPRCITMASPCYLERAARTEMESTAALSLVKFSYVAANQRTIQSALTGAQAKDISPEALAKGVVFDSGEENIDGEQIEIEGLTVAGQSDRDDTSVVRLVQAILLYGIQNRATDIHISGHRDRMWVRFRIDGVFSEYPHILPAGMTRTVISRLKVLAHMETQYCDLPLNGKFLLTVGESKYEIRINTSNTVISEKAVLRVQPRDATIPTLDSLGIGGFERNIIERLIDSEHGLLIITGPTGAGKSTTLYAAIGQIDRRQWNVITAEDPVEMEIPDTEQHAIKGEFTFDKAVEEALRQDPDIIMVAEIRSQIEAEAVIRAAITGHVVMTTLHTNNAAGAVVRLIDLGIQPYILADALTGVCAQRLLRCLCTNCSVPIAPPTRTELAGMHIPFEWIPADAKFRTARGCPLCHGTGYKGRIGIMEGYFNTPIIRDIIKKQQGSPSKIRAAMINAGGKPLLQHAFERAAMGVTSLTEVLAVASLDDVI